MCIGWTGQMPHKYSIRPIGCGDVLVSGEGRRSVCCTEMLSKNKHEGNSICTAQILIPPCLFFKEHGIVLAPVEALAHGDITVWLQELVPDVCKGLCERVRDEAAIKAAIKSVDQPVDQAVQHGMAQAMRQATNEAATNALE